MKIYEIYSNFTRYQQITKFSELSKSHTMADKSFRDIVTELEPDSVASSLEMIRKPENFDKRPSKRQYDKISACSTSAAKILKIVKICNLPSNLEKVASDTKLVATTMSLIHEENKMCKWDFRKFEPQEENVFVSGEFKIWIRDLKDYCVAEKFNEENKLKGFLNKSGKFLQQMISTVKTTKPNAFVSFDSAVAAINEELTPPGGSGLIDLTFRSCEPKPSESNSEYLVRLARWSTYVDFPSENDRATAILNTAMQKVTSESLKSDIYKYGFIDKSDDRMNAVKQIINLAKISDSKKTVVKKLGKRPISSESDEHSSDSDDGENSARVMNVMKKPNRADHREQKESKVENLLKSLLQEMRKSGSRSGTSRPGPSRNSVKPDCNDCGKQHFGRCWNTMKCHACGKFGHFERNCPGKYRRERSRSPPRQKDSKFDRSRKRVMKTEKKEKNDNDEKVKKEEGKLSSSDSD